MSSLHRGSRVQRVARVWPLHCFPAPASPHPALTTAGMMTVRQARTAGSELNSAATLACPSARHAARPPPSSSDMRSVAPITNLPAACWPAANERASSVWAATARLSASSELASQTWQGCGAGGEVKLIPGQTLVHLKWGRCCLHARSGTSLSHPKTRTAHLEANLVRRCVCRVCARCEGCAQRIHPHDGQRAQRQQPCAAQVAQAAPQRLSARQPQLAAALQQD